MSIVKKNHDTFPVVDGDNTITVSSIGTVRSSVPTKEYVMASAELCNGELVVENPIFSVFANAIGAHKEILEHSMRMNNLLMWHL